MRPGSWSAQRRKSRHREAYCHGTSALLSPWTGRDMERDVVRGNQKWKGSVAGLGDLSRPVDSLPFHFLL